LTRVVMVGPNFWLALKDLTQGTPTSVVDFLRYSDAITSWFRAWTKRYRSGSSVQGSPVTFANGSRPAFGGPCPFVGDPPTQGTPRSVKQQMPRPTSGASLFTLMVIRASPIALRPSLLSKAMMFFPGRRIASDAVLSAFCVNRVCDTVFLRSYRLPTGPFPPLLNRCSNAAGLFGLMVYARRRPPFESPGNKLAPLAALKVWSHLPPRISTRCQISAWV